MCCSTRWRPSGRQTLQVEDAERPPGPTSRPTTINTIPATIWPRTKATIPAMTRTAAMIHNRVAAPPAQGDQRSEDCQQCTHVVIPSFPALAPRPARAPGCPGRTVGHVRGGQRLRDLLEGLAHLALGGRRHRHVAEREDAHQLVVLHDREAADPEVGHHLLGLGEPHVGADRRRMPCGDVTERDLHRVLALGHHTDDKVTVGDEADELPVLDDRDDSHVELPHETGGVGGGHVGPCRLRCRRHGMTYQRRHPSSFRARRGARQASGVPTSAPPNTRGRGRLHVWGTR